MSDHLEFSRRWNLQQLDAGAVPPEVLGEVMRVGAEAIQRTDPDLTIDGLLGPATCAHVAERLGVTRDRRRVRTPSGDPPPVPTPANVRSTYGHFRYEADPRQRGAIIIERQWVKSNITSVKLHSGRTIQTHSLIAREVKDLFREACQRSGYTPERVGCWVPRHKMWDPERSLSTHAWGVAVDFDPRLNKYGAKSGTPLHDNPEFVQVWTDAGWTWGGYWRTPDPMHFQRTR